MTPPPSLPRALGTALAGSPAAQREATLAGLAAPAGPTGGAGGARTPSAGARRTLAAPRAVPGDAAIRSEP
jgi:hypothetical protein